jgi:hypothetical protein
MDIINIGYRGRLEHDSAKSDLTMRLFFLAIVPSSLLRPHISVDRISIRSLPLSLLNHSLPVLDTTFVPKPRISFAVWSSQQQDEQLPSIPPHRERGSGAPTVPYENFRADGCA